MTAPISTTPTPLLSAVRAAATASTDLASEEALVEITSALQAAFSGLGPAQIRAAGVEVAARLREGARTGTLAITAAPTTTAVVGRGIDSATHQRALAARDAATDRSQGLEEAMYGLLAALGDTTTVDLPATRVAGSDLGRRLRAAAPTVVAATPNEIATAVEAAKATIRGGVQGRLTAVETAVNDYTTAQNTFLKATARFAEAPGDTTLGTAEQAASRAATTAFDRLQRALAHAQAAVTPPTSP